MLRRCSHELEGALIEGCRRAGVAASNDNGASSSACFFFFGRSEVEFSLFLLQKNQSHSCSLRRGAGSFSSALLQLLLPALLGPLPSPSAARQVTRRSALRFHLRKLGNNRRCRIDIDQSISPPSPLPAPRLQPQPTLLTTTRQPWASTRKRVPVGSARWCGFER